MQSGDVGRAFRRLLLGSASAAALLTVAAAPAQATGCSINDNGVSIPSVSNAAAINCINIQNSTVTGSVTNTASGTISATGTTPGVATATGITVNNSTIGGSIVNAGSISSVGGVGISFGGNSASLAGGISNSGLISANNGGISLFGSGTMAGGVANSGTINGNGAGVLLVQVSNFSGGIANTNTGSSITANGTAIVLNNVSAFAGGISNAGLIKSLDEYGIDLTNVQTFAGGISNTGTISARFDGISAAAVSTFSGGISNGGTISSTGSNAINLTPQTFTGGISNSGTISGARHGLVTQTSTFAGGITNGGTIAATSFNAVFVNDLTFSGGISNNGVISAGEQGIFINQVSTFSGGISSSGTISANIVAGSAAILVDRVGAFSGGISNDGDVISTLANGIFVDQVSTFSGGISNAGTISIAAGGDTGIAAFSISTFSGGVTNSGTIAGALGINVESNQTFTGGIVNDQTITARESGIAVGSGLSFGGGIINNGSIAGGGDAIIAQNLSTLSGGITNSGTISGGFTGIQVSNVGTISGTISNTGLISGHAAGLRVKTSGPVSIFDSGTIFATGGLAVDLTQNAAGNTFTLGPGYSITGMVEGQGSDTLQLGGTGNGAFNLSNIGTQYTGVTTFNEISGNWTLTGAGTNTWNVSGGSFTLASGATLSTTNTAVRVGPVSTFSGNITNAGTISSSNGTGVLITGVSTFSGNVANSGTIAAPTGGAVVLASIGTFSGGVTNSGSIGGGTGVRVTGISSFSGGIANSSSGTITGISTAIFIGDVATFSGGITNAGLIAAAGVGAGIRGVSSFGGGVTNSGTMLGFSGGFIASGMSTFSGGIVNTSSGSFGGGIAGVGAIDVSLFSGGISNAGRISGASGGGVVLSGVGTFTGGISNSGTILASGPVFFQTGIAVLGVSTFSGGISNSGTISGPTGILATASGPLAIFDSGTIVGTGGTAVDLTNNAPGNTFTLGPGYAITGLVAGQGSDAFQLGGTGTGTFDLSTIGTQYTGFTTFNVVSAAWSVTNTDTHDWSIANGATLQIGTGGTSGLIGGDIANNGVLVFDRSDSVTYAGAISGGGQVQQIGTGTLTLTATNSYTGGTTISAGTLQVGNGGAVGSITGDVLDNATFAFDRSDNGATFAGIISGSGVVQQIGTGTLTLTGANTYQGGTALNSGTLVVGDNTALGTGTLNMAAGTTLGFTGDGITIANPIKVTGDPIFTPPSGSTDTISGVISDGGSPGTVEMDGAGTLVLAADNTYTGATKVNSGTLDVTGSIATTSGVTVASGATLTGSGTLHNVQIASGGAFVPGGSTASTTTIAGTLALPSGSTYVVQVTPSSATSTNVGGTATLGGAALAVFSTGSYPSTAQFDILHAGSLGGTTFSSFDTLGLPTAFKASLSYGANDVFLNLQLIQMNLAGLGGNQQSVGAALNRFAASGASLPPNVIALFGLSGPALSSALSQLSGEDATGASRGAFDMNNALYGLLLDPFVDGMSGNGWSSLDRQASAGAPASVRPAQLSAFAPGWSTWFAGYGGAGETDGDPLVAGTHDVNAHIFGLAAGADYRFTPDAVIGGALGWGGTTWSLSQSLGRGQSDAIQAALYGAARSGPAYVTGAFVFANHWVTTNRFAVGDHLLAHYTAQSIGGRVEGGWRFEASPDLGLTPYLAAQVQDFETPAYSETDLNGGGFGLSYASASPTSKQAELGVRFDHDGFSFGDTPLVIRGRVAWAHDWGNAPFFNASFETLPGTGFVVHGAKFPSDTALTSLSAELPIASQLSLHAGLDGQFGNGAETVTGTGSFRFTW